MDIAKVIVDVPSSAINQTFDYQIPKQYKDMVQPGMRVVIPFGQRTITGFVVELTDYTEVKRMRNIKNVLDLTPVLTNELLSLGKWLAETTFCLYITAFQAMLPQVLKSTYKKELTRLTDEELFPALEHVFSDKESISFEELEASSIRYVHVQKAIEQGRVKVNYLVESNITKKYETWITPLLVLEELQKERDALTGRAHRQKALLDYFITYPDPIEQQKLLHKTDASRQTIKTLIDKGIFQEEHREVMRDPYENHSFDKTPYLQLTEEQEQSMVPIRSSIKHNEHDVILVHGVTGSGKTEIYLQAIKQVVDDGKEAIVLVPEIALTPQMVKRFKERFGSQVAVLHSALSAGEKYDEWRKIQRQEVQVVVGARSAVFAPFKNIGIIIIDEEHELTYKQEDQPKYHARDVAIERGKTHRAPVVLGSATPSLESFARAKKGVYTLTTLTERTNKRAMPQVDIVDMRDELHKGNRTMFSMVLQEKLKARIEKGEQIVLMLNRRGFSTFLMCRDCGHVTECPHCDISLTYHKGRNKMKCHYCTYEANVPKQCPSCSSELIRFFGTGTERVQEELVKVIPGIRIIRMDVDTTRRKGSHERLLDSFGNQEADVLLGTQMIAKGLDFPNVTLVGVLAADSMLHLPDFRSSEKTFQLLTQVSGRAGRHELDGEVIVQTYTPEHYSVEFARDYDYGAFYEHEMRMRHTFKYPPYVYLALFTVTHPDVSKCMQVTDQIVQTISEFISSKTIILGPTPSPITRIKNKFRYQCMIKYRHEPNLMEGIQKVFNMYQDEIQKKHLNIFIDMQPYHLM